ncbi:uncharacterized protein TNCV_1452591 [Trichonephila clavipes]|nr:uncharacterized protein TNCV_1452591 [Trichonephila clavipes]
MHTGHATALSNELKKHIALTAMCTDTWPITPHVHSFLNLVKVPKLQSTVIPLYKIISFAQTPLIHKLPHTKMAAVAEWYRNRILAFLVTSSSPIPLKTHRVGQRCTLNMSRAETSFRYCGLVIRRKGVPAQVTSSSIDIGSNLRNPSPKALT